MAYDFLNIFLDPKELLLQDRKDINSFLLENNVSQIEKIYNFYKSNINLLYVNGFLGTGKAEIVNYSIAFLSPETLVFKYNCFNSTVLDDILLSFFSDFKKLSAQNIIFEPKVKTENFTQKVNSYFSQIEKPFVIILDSFESVLEENRQEILDFIFHLNSMQKVKIIIIGRTFESKYFQNINIERVTTFALEREIFEKYLKSEKIKFSTIILDEFYKHTRGYYFFTALSIRLMKLEDLSLMDFLTRLKESYLPFSNFLEKQASKLVPATARNLFWFLVMIRHPINFHLLRKLNFYKEKEINFLIENLIIIRDDSNIYVQDYLKEEADETTSSHVLQKIRQYIIDLYLTQLPLKPLERDICVSRQTMRKEIEYHNRFLPKKPKIEDTPAIDINYLSYSKVFELEEKIPQKVEDKTEFQKEDKSKLDLTQRKNISINIDNLPFQKKETGQEEKIKEEKSFTLKEILTLIKKSEASYQYARVIELCQKVLLMKNDNDFQLYLPVIYTKLAHAYQKIAEYENSLKYYELAENFYENSQNFVKVNQIRFNIARIFYETYKIEKAKEIFIEITKSGESSDVLIVKSYIQLANMEEDSSNSQKALEYYKLAIGAAGEMMSIEILSELYFKYALILDDKNEIEIAMEFYNKCINLGGDFKNNKFLSSSYSNIAALYLERNDIEKTLNNYTKAYETDKKGDNFEGTYYSASKLASILKRSQPEKALEYFKISLDSAKKTKDIFYIISASLELGDFHYDMKQNEIALKYYLKALDMAQNNLSQDNIYKINVRINDIKLRLGAEKFDNLADIIRKQNNE